MTTDLGPAATPRPVPSPEDRMADARTDTPHTFRTWMSDTERDQLVETIGRLVSLPPEQIAEMHKVGYSGSAPSSVPSRRAQEATETDVPDWVLELIRGLAKYEAEHPKLFRYAGGDAWCPCSLLEGVPKAIREQARP